MSKIQKCSNVRTIAQFFKEKKTAVKLQQKQQAALLKQQQELELQQKQQAAELRLTNFIKKIAKEIIGDIPKYKLQTNKRNVLQSSNAILETSDSVWAPWSPSYKGKK